jgi:hypothetical protein
MVIGDLNSYAMEDPIQAFIDAGYTNLLKTFDGPDAYSYVFQGQTGTLDHALGSPTLTAQVTGATEWHINPDEPTVLDYNVNFKTANQVITFYAPDAYRSSDHDPALVGVAAAGYDFTGFFPPAGGPPLTVTAGATVPVKFSRGGDQGLDVLFGQPTVTTADCATWAPLDGAVAAGTAGGTSLIYDPLADQYVFAWKTARSLAGTCAIFELTLADGSYHTLAVSFR